MTRTVLIIAICAACTFLERLLPFLLFSGREVPALVRTLGKVLPTAVMTALVIFCLRGTDFSTPAGFLPQLIAGGLTAALHLWKGNVLLSVAGGTISYMLLLQLVFG